MNNNSRAVELYRLLRGGKPASRMLLHFVIGLSFICVWSLLTPIDQAVSFRARLVSTVGSGGEKGTYQPHCANGGLVKSVAVVELQKVREGDVLLRFDSSELELRRDGKGSEIGNMRLEIEAKQLQRKLAIASFEAKKAELLTKLTVQEKSEMRLVGERKIKVDRGRAEFARAEIALSRAQRLIEKKTISRVEFEAAESDWLKAKEEFALANLPIEEAGVAEVKAQLRSLEKSHDELLHKIETEELSLTSKVTALSNEVQLLDLQIEKCTVLAQRAGTVSACSVGQGDWVPPGPIDLTVSQDGYIAEAFLPSQLIGEVRKGNSAVVLLDGFDWLVHGSIRAEVKEISAGLVEEETALGDGSSTEVDGYRVWLDLDKSSDFENWKSLRLGMTGTVEIKTGEEKLAIHLLRRAIGERWFQGN